MQSIAIVQYILASLLPSYRHLSRLACLHDCHFLLRTDGINYNGANFLRRRRKDDEFVSWRGSWHPHPPHAAGNCDNLAIVSHNGGCASPTARAGVGPAGTEWAGRAKIYAAYRDYMLVEQRAPFVQAR